MPIYRSGLLLLSLLPTMAVAQSDLPFSTAKVIDDLVSRERVLDGVVEAVNKTTVSAQTSGQVESIHYDVDDFVKQGQVIVKLKAKKQSASARQAKAGLEEARARLKQAQQEHSRIESIYDRKLVAKAKLDTATAELTAAKARLAGAKASMSKADEQLSDTQIRAPYSGIVTDRYVEAGEFVKVGKQLMTGISLDQLRISVDVPQRLINKVRELKKARLIDTPAGSVPVTDLTFFPYADAGSNTFKVRVNLAEKVSGLFPGMFVKVAFTTGEHQQLVVPEEAIAYRGEVTGAYVLNDEQIPLLRYVRLGHHAGAGNIVVLSGLIAGEEVALDPIAAGIYRKRQADSVEKAHD